MTRTNNSSAATTNEDPVEQKKQKHGVDEAIYFLAESHNQPLSLARIETEADEPLVRLLHQLESGQKNPDPVGAAKATLRSRLEKLVAELLPQLGPDESRFLGFELSEIYDAWVLDPSRSDFLQQQFDAIAARFQRRHQKYGIAAD